MNTTPTAPAPTYEAVSSLLKHSAYNPAIVPQLEAYVKAQVSSPQTAPYHFDANRTLAKLYRFFPHLSDDGVGSTAMILFLAMLEFPSTDFTALSCLVPEKAQARDPCATLCRCADLLENCQFVDFWSTYHDIGSSTDSTTPDSSTSSSPVLTLLSKSAQSLETKDKLRLHILGVLALSYRTAPMEVVLKCLDVSSKEDLTGLAQRKKEGWDKWVESVEGEKEVTFLPTVNNTKRSRVYKEEIHFESIASLMAAARE